MTTNNNQEIIKGLNEEKIILTTQLVNLSTCNATITTRSSIEQRLKDVDDFLKKLSE